MQKNDAVTYQALKARFLALHLDEREERIIHGRTLSLVADGHSHTGALKRALMERKVKL